MDDLPLDDLRRVVQTLTETLKCPVCLEILKPDIVICINGHTICKECKRDQVICPTCRNDFSNIQQPSFVRQVLGALPSRSCRFENCSYLVKPEDDHEVYCGYRPTTCKLCDWRGTVVDLGEHVEDNHQPEVHSEICVINYRLDYNNTRDNIYLFKVYGRFLWVETSYNIYKEVVKHVFSLVPIGKPTHNIFVEYSLMSTESKSKNYKIKMQLNTDPSVDPARENSMYIQNPVLKRFSKLIVGLDILCLFSFTKE